MNMIVRILLSGLAVFIAAYVLPGVHVEHFGYALLVAGVLALVNILVKPLLVLFTIPLTLLTLGLFLLVINALMILLVDYFITPGFTVDGFWWALVFSNVCHWWSLPTSANSVGWFLGKCFILFFSVDW
jgi:putative membrane protein